MRAKTIAQNVSLNSATSGSAVDLSGEVAPFLPNNTVLALIHTDAAPGTEFKLEGRNDDSGAWATLATFDAAGIKVAPVTLTQEVRWTVVGTVAGVGSIILIGN